jgi:heavy metal sensor kinase
VRVTPRQIRTRLTLWYVAMFAAGLLLYICCAAVLQFWQLRSQLYHAAVQDIETAEGLLYFKPDGKLAMQEEYHNHPESLLLIDRLMEVIGRDGTILYRNGRLGDRELGGPPFPGEGEKGYSERSAELLDGTRILMISHIHSIDGHPLLIRLAYNQTHLVARMKEFTGLLLFALPLALAVVGFMAYTLTRRALNPLATMAGQASQITASRLQDRLPIENPDDELGHIATAFNGLLERLENSFEQLRRFTADASHELRTPLAALQSVGEMGLQREYSSAEYRDILGSMLEEVTRLTRMVESLLTISRADAGEIKLKKSVFSLVDLVHEAIGLVDVLAEERGQFFHVRATQEYYVEADRLLLRQAILNILHNAMKYANVGGKILVSLTRGLRDSENVSLVNLEIVDDGPGIPKEHQARVFDRFYRVDEGRSRETGGAGLGLAIAKWAVEVNGGEIGVKSSLESGCSFFIRLPEHLSTPRASSAGD